MKLNIKQIEAAKPKDKAYKLADGGGLYLEISPKGSKYWRMKYRRPTDKKEDRLAFGVYPIISLADARKKRDEAKNLITQGIDPKAQQKIEKAELNNELSFETVARRWHAANKKWGEETSKRILGSLELHIFPHIGKENISSLTVPALLAPIKIVEGKNHLDMAGRLKQRVTAIMRYAVQNGIIKHNPANDLSGAIATREATHPQHYH